MSVECLDIPYGEEILQIRLRRRPRKTLSISVDPQLNIDVVAPTDAPPEKIIEKIKLRAPWIKKQLRYFDQFQPRTPDRLFISGETHLYLGRQYKLRVKRDQEERVKLYRGKLLVRTSKPTNKKHVHSLVDGWYRERAHLKFPERLAHCQKLFANPREFSPSELVIRQLKQRWGSMTPAGRLIVNPALLKASVDTIDYVITHELCHMKHAHHGPEFIKLLTRVMPDWEARKNKLERRMA